jgi:hypothetical protein
MSDDVHLAMMGLAICDAIEEGGTNATARMESVMKARKHAHAVINRNKPQAEQPLRCVCLDESRGPCDCRGECMCAE